MKKMIIGAIVGVTIIILAIIIVIIINKNKIELEKIELEYIGEIKINPELTEPMPTAHIEIYRNYNRELMKEYETNKPYLGRILNIEHRQIIEETYNIKIDFEEDYDEGKVLYCIGSKIEELKITDVYEDELSQYKASKRYTTDATFSEEFDGNVIYFYRVNRTDIVLPKQM